MFFTLERREKQFVFAQRSKQINVIGATCSSENVNLMSIEETENHIDGDQRAMCKETFSNAERE